MGQISATWKKTIKEFLRQKTVLFWTIGWPIIWVLIGSFSFTTNIPSDTLSYTRGAISISMMVFALMTAGMANLPGNIVQDRERGLLKKIMSMPISPWRDFTGRILALLAFSGLSAILVVVVGFVVVARTAVAVVARFSVVRSGSVSSRGLGVPAAGVGVRRIESCAAGPWAKRCFFVAARRSIVRRAVGGRAVGVGRCVALIGRLTVACVAACVGRGTAAIWRARVAGAGRRQHGGAGSGVGCRGIVA